MYLNAYTENIYGNFLESGMYIARKNSQEENLSSKNEKSYNMVIVDITTSFTILIGIFFPSVTGLYFITVKKERNEFCLLLLY